MSSTDASFFNSFVILWGLIFQSQFIIVYFSKIIQIKFHFLISISLIQLFTPYCLTYGQVSFWKRQTHLFLYRLILKSVLLAWSVKVWFLLFHFCLMVRWWKFDHLTAMVWFLKAYRGVSLDTNENYWSCPIPMKRW